MAESCRASCATLDLTRHPLLGTILLCRDGPGKCEVREEATKNGGTRQSCLGFGRTARARGVWLENFDAPTVS